MSDLRAVRAASAALVVLAATAASAVTFGVDDTADAVDAAPGDCICASASGACTLRAAAMEANACPGDDHIELPEGVYLLTLPGAAEDQAASGDLDLLETAVVEGIGRRHRVVVDGGGLDAVFDLRSASTLTNLTVTGGVAQGGFFSGGGGVNANGFQRAPARVRDCLVRDNLGAGIYSSLSGLVVEDSEVSGNDGFGIETFPDTGEPLDVLRSTLSENAAGGLFAADRSVLVEDSTVDGNHGHGIEQSFEEGIVVSGTTISANDGFGIVLGDVAFASVANSTITTNGAGGVFLRGFPSSFFGVGVTLAGNAGPGLHLSREFQDATLQGSILARNAPDCVVESNPLAEPRVHLGHSVLGEADGCVGLVADEDSRVGSGASSIDPGLLRLTDNGGPTATRGLELSSPALDLVPEFVCIATDQRGVPRPQQERCDAGAFERAAAGFFCGAGRVQPDEQCDEGDLAPGDGCDEHCQEEVCGNGIPQAGEECDDGDTEIGDGCRPDCTLEVCGDGIQDAGEACDDGNANEVDGCTSQCTVGALCGDGTLEAPEVCDDGNLLPGDGCRPTCTVELCGDGILDPGEECDDGVTGGSRPCRPDCRLAVPVPEPYGPLLLLVGAAVLGASSILRSASRYAEPSARRSASAIRRLASGSPRVGR